MQNDGDDISWALLAKSVCSDYALLRQDPALSPQPTRVDVVVAEADCPPAVRTWARLCHTPVVSGEWVVGSVVAHRQLGFSARPEFHYRGREESPDG